MTTARDLLDHEDMMMFQVKWKYLLQDKYKEFYEVLDKSFMTNENLKMQPENYITTQTDPYVYFDLDRHEVCSEQYNEHGDWWGWKTEKLAPQEFFRRLLRGK